MSIFYVNLLKKQNKTDDAASHNILKKKINWIYTCFVVWHWISLGLKDQNSAYHLLFDVASAAAKVGGANNLWLMCLHILASVLRNRYIHVALRFFKCENF